MGNRKQVQDFETTSRSDKRTLAASGHRLRLKAQPDLEEIKEKIGEIADKRFYNLKKRIIADLDGAAFKNIDVGLYIRLGVWSHIGASYRKTAEEVKARSGLPAFFAKAQSGRELRVAGRPSAFSIVSMKVISPTGWPPAGPR